MGERSTYVMFLGARGDGQGTSVTARILARHRVPLEVSDGLHPNPDSEWSLANFGGR